MTDETPDPDETAHIDWRTNRVDWVRPEAEVGADAGRPAAEPVAQSASVKFGLAQLEFAVPNATALFLHLSRQCHEEAASHFAKAMSLKDESGRLPDDAAFAYFERIAASAMFACAALESFVNEMLPDSYTHPVVEKKRTEQYTKVRIERYLNLRDKIGEVLPLALGIDTPKGGPLWDAFQELVDLRDRMTHMKTKDREARGVQHGGVWNGLVAEPIPQTDAVAKAILGHFLDGRPRQPRWFKRLET